MSKIQSVWCSALCGLLVAGFSAALLPAQPAAARRWWFPWRSEPVSRSAFFTCDYELKQMGVNAADRTAACGSALYPKDISGCVVRIVNENQIAPSEALSTCRQVRRPLELATCVTDINQMNVFDDRLVATDRILQTCQRSLLPKRFSQCVVGMSWETDLPISDLMNRCIEARDRPRGFYPNLPNGLQPLSPTPGAPPALQLIPGIEPSPDELRIR